MPLLQARRNTSNDQFCGQPKAELPICTSVLNELNTSHSSGSTISRAHRAREPCEKAISTTPSPRGSWGRAPDFLGDGWGGTVPPAGAVSFRGALIVVCL